MTATLICYVIVYLGSLIAYFFSETSGNFARRCVNKIIMAGMFLAIGFGGLIENGMIPTALGITLAIGLLFAAIGDAALLWSFTLGGISFGIGNVTLFIAYLQYLSFMGVSFSQYWWFLIIYVIFCATWLILMKTGWIDFDKYGIKMVLYLFSVMLHGTLSIAGCFCLQDPRSLLMFIGSIFFMISDWFISLHKFKYKESKLVHRCNSGTYFFGMLLIALGFQLF